MVALAILGLVAFGWCLPYLLGFKGSDTPPPARHWTEAEVDRELKKRRQWQKEEWRRNP